MTHNTPLPFSPSLITLTVSVDAKHHVYLLFDQNVGAQKLCEQEAELSSHTESYSPLHQLFSTVGSADTASVTVFPVCTGWFPTTLTSIVLVEVFSLAFDGWSSWDEHY